MGILGLTRSRVGMMKAAVLPVPFLARARTSRPVRAIGIASSWMGDGRSNWAAAKGGGLRSVSVGEREGAGTYAGLEDAHEEFTLEEVVFKVVALGVGDILWVQGVCAAVAPKSANQGPQGLQVPRADSPRSGAECPFGGG